MNTTKNIFHLPAVFNRIVLDNFLAVTFRLSTVTLLPYHHEHVKHYQWVVNFYISLS